MACLVCGPFVCKRLRIECFVAPRNNQRRADDHQTQAKANPDPNRSPGQPKAQKIAERQAYLPVSDSIRQHWGSSVASAAQRPRRHYLQSIE